MRDHFKQRLLSILLTGGIAFLSLVAAPLTLTGTASESASGMALTNDAHLDQLNSRLETANKAYLIAGGFTVFFTILTLAASYFIYHYSNQKSAAEQVAANEAAAKVAAAQAAAEQAKADAAIANRQANEAAREAAALRLDNTKLQFQLAQIREPRNMPVAQFNAVWAAVKPYAGTVYDLSQTPNDMEVAGLTAQIISLLNQAGWKHIDWVDTSGVTVDSRDNVKSGQATASGVHVIVPEGASVELHKAAEALSNTLNLNGVAALKSSQKLASTTPNVVHVVVGRKPIFSPEQEEERERQLQLLFPPSPPASGSNR